MTDQIQDLKFNPGIGDHNSVNYLEFHSGSQEPNRQTLIQGTTWK